MTWARWLKIGNCYVRPEEIAAIAEGDRFNPPRVFLRGNSTEFRVGEPGGDIRQLLEVLGATDFVDVPKREKKSEP